jgi:hypothetical protein
LSNDQYLNSIHSLFKENFPILSQIPAIYLGCIHCLIYCICRQSILHNCDLGYQLCCLFHGNCAFEAFQSFSESVALHHYTWLLRLEIAFFNIFRGGNFESFIPNLIRITEETNFVHFSTCEHCTNFVFCAPGGIQSLLGTHPIEVVKHLYLRKSPHINILNFL